ncbi:hypothetical protein [Pengzhenrongella frigida]|uniref:Uncharacterized protein n=1 Tax=Pengzhenrongella frigida TaxID=1259133 RepID=A0A4Q5N3Q0_9MICO|nr:hypothetical protein [Cellulomonas sp. HLT2-17]RYV52869.1 hypothetical protein EUA98_01350 [Cellulomonas sp. HLT2-17]
MRYAKKSTWIGGTVFLALVIAVAAWFLAISPTFTTAADSRATTVSTEQQNSLLVQQLTGLKADFEKLPEYKAELATLRTQIPVDAGLAVYLRELNAIAETHSVTITALTPSPPLAFTPVAPLAAVVAGPTDGTETDPAVDAVVAAPTASSGLVQSPYAMTVVGSRANALAFLADLQKGTPRLFLVTALTGTGQKVGAASGGRPATVDGDVELVITGTAYVLPDLLAVK